MADNRIEVQIITNVESGELDSLESEVQSLKESAEEASQAFEDLNNATESTNSGNLEDVAGAADDVAGSARDAEDGLEGINQSLSVMEGAMLLDVADKVGQLGSQAESMAQDMNTAAISVGQLATQTGIAEPQMVALINNISNATFPQDEAMMYVKSLDQIGVASQNLGASATDLDRINDAFGLGASTTNSLGQELSVLGVDMNNVSTSFNALAYANANTVGGMENYYSFLRRYDSQFHELGYNVDQASIIIAGATQKFGGGRAALTGLSEALKNADGDSRKLEEALGLQAGSLDNASQVTGQYNGVLQQLANEEAEHKTLLDQIGAAWEDVTLSMSPILSPLTSFMGLIGQAGQWAVGVNGIIQLTQTMRALELQNIKTAASWVLEKAQMVTSTIAKGAATVASWALAAAEWAAASPLVLLVVLIGAVVLALVALYMNSEQVRVGIDNLINDISNGVTSALNYISQLPSMIGAYIGNVINTIITFRNNLINGFVDGARNAVNGFMQYISSLPGRFLGELNKMLQYAKNFVLTLPSYLKNAAINMVKAWVFGSGESSPGFMYDAFEGELEAMRDAPSQYTIGLNKNIRGMATDMVDNWNPSLGSLNQSMQSTTNNLNNNPVRDINIYIESVDSQDRINKIADAVTRVLRFENTTAGRTV